ncbi:MAG: acetyl-CoA carboxylase biotin carboxylase subunit [bacterium]
MSLPRTTFRTVLVANRGEIACRVLRSARELGYRTVAVFSDADADAPHVGMADAAARIGPPPAKESYLSPTAILDAARATGADAVHPGYGVLSENADFAQACGDAGLVFIGPPTEPIRLMGNKREAKAIMEAAGVPCIPGYHDAAQDDGTLTAAAARIGYPLMVKASAGGGGRGLRLAAMPEDLPDALRSARSEAENAFGSGELLLEKALPRPRHVEIQVLADAHGNAVHLGERDCSVQRRHQKVIEEAPAPGITPELRERMGAAAVTACQAIGYRNAGTVEFLLDEDGTYYFLEMNTRLQVEHPVTEMVTGLDLVGWQLRIAAGEALDFSQADVTLSGHAIEARLYAEDPARGFLPCTGRVLAWLPPQGPGVRVDHGLRTGLEIGAHYDPMLAKIVAHGRDREEARRRLLRAMEETVLLGVGHNTRFLADVLSHPEFIAAKAATDFIPAHMDGWGGAERDDMETLRPSLARTRLSALAAVALYSGPWEHRGQPGIRGGAKHPLPDGDAPAAPPATFLLRGGTTEGSVTVTSRPGGVFSVSTGEWEGELKVLERNDTRWRVELDGVQSTVHVAVMEGEAHVAWGGTTEGFEDVRGGNSSKTDSAAGGRLTAPTTGRVISVRAEPGQTVRRGECLVVLEAMKLEHEIEAPVTGTVKTVAVSEGQQVAARDLLMELVPETEQGN